MHSSLAPSHPPTKPATRRPPGCQNRSAHLAYRRTRLGASQAPRNGALWRSSSLILYPPKATLHPLYSQAPLTGGYNSTMYFKRVY
ncbi:hypothetical protein N7468_003774 [Penicillium chermesinum]|uniref:Uncharacterized protein n=1 Tax=Penicillium chermesinum TaxID=63820 RepID=A0A9W9TRX8_9EURO|nr:uncharacterized protein N7468_003774 [Penicillium chermesinum]KAJ5239155.1 hypothetical protein N7468_003774 [Penicillium chermesinum]